PPKIILYKEVMIVNISMNQFVNTGADEALLKSLPVGEDCPEELAKAMNKQGLVQKEVTVQGANGKTFTRKQWVRASDAAASSGQSGSSLPKVGDTIKTDKAGELKIIKVEGDRYTVKNANGIVSHVSEQFIRDNTRGQGSQAAAQAAPKGKFTAQDFQFRSGGQETVDMANELDKLVGVESHVNGAAGFGTFKCKNGERVGFGNDKIGAYLTWQGQTFRSAKALNDAWSGKKEKPAASSKPKDQPQTAPKQQLSTGGISFKLPAHGDTKKAMVELLASGKSRDDIIFAAKAAGITWTANDNAGINWMRASMAIQKHMKSGSDANSQPKSSTAPDSTSTGKKPKIFTESGGIKGVTRGGVGGQYMIHRKSAKRYVMLQATKKDGSWGKPSKTELYDGETPEDALKRIQQNNPDRKWQFDPDSMED
ncbi:MAG: hypothetical protein NC548_20130, partial [Lachnospiraceae bacterium]|nr:hypothetical protein [Lachnospiraceae bacterium]